MNNEDLTPTRVLLIAYNFPPLISPQSLRWFYLARELSQKGWDIDVLTMKMPKRFRDILDELPNNVKTHRTFPGPFYYLTFKYSRESPSKEGQDVSAESNRFWKILSSIHFKAYKALNSILVPDIYSEWLPFAVKAGLELIRSNRYDVIISSSEPRVCHLVGYFLKKNGGITWIADYGDPWIYPVPILAESDFKKRLMEKTERAMLKKMDAISVAAEGIKKLYLKRYPFLDSDKIHVIPQGFDPDMFSQVEAEKSHKFRIVYCGSFYKNLRDPMAFFEAIKEIDKDDIEVIIAGRINEYADILRGEKFYNKIKYLGFLSHKESLSWQKGATVLLHIGNANDVQVPGKIYEYIGARRPIICIRGGEGDLSADIISQYNKGIIADNDKEAIKEGILRLYELWKNDLLDKSFNLNAIEDFTWQKSAKDIIKITGTL